ncbi:PEP-CTERM sorting domain-containing protein, partial [Betaproteobacteria bacterium PRO4]|nr:PEP-CTERM sorting domain-containing protein [Betaproteobacteria bacterium PRO4]
VTLSAIPEPATIALIGLGILGMGTIQRRKISATLPVC